MLQRESRKRYPGRSRLPWAIAFPAQVESLETRRLLAIVVNTTLDETVANSTTSLREAIAQAQSNAGDDTITFSSSVFSSGSLHTITLSQGSLNITSAS